MSTKHTLRSRNPDDSQYHDQAMQQDDDQNELTSGNTSAEHHGTEFQSNSTADWRKNKSSVALLLFLYILQGIPLGLAGSIPLILQQANVGYKDQAIFSLVFWPFTLKLVWAPFVDGIYNRKMGRRKSWLVPVQYGIGVLMIWLSFYVMSMISGGGSGTPQLYMLTASFFILNLLAATQDIAVDGWALTMLDRCNVGYASTCNSVGQTAGYFLGNVVFLALESADFCNKYLRSVPAPTGIVTLDVFLLFWGFVFLVTTTLVWVFKPEKPERHDIKRVSSGSDVEDEWSTEEYAPGDGESLGVMATYGHLLSIFRLRNIQIYVGCSLLAKIGTAAADSLTGLKLVEYGVAKEKLALLGVPVVPLQIILPLIISRYTAGPRPLSIWMLAYIPRLLCGFIFAGVVWWTRSLGPQYGTGEFPSYYYGVVIFTYALHQVTVYAMFVAVMAWHSRISDPRVGGTYMTLLNTVSNLAANWPSMLAMWCVDMLTTRQCRDEKGSILSATCPTANAEECTKAGGHCIVTSDGYFVEIFLGVAIGLVWFFLLGKKLRSLELANLQSWRIPSAHR